MQDQLKQSGDVSFGHLLLRVFDPGLQSTALLKEAALRAIAMAEDLEEETEILEDVEEETEDVQVP